MSRAVSPLCGLLLHHRLLRECPPISLSEHVNVRSAERYLKRMHAVRCRLPYAWYCRTAYAALQPAEGRTRSDRLSAWPSGTAFNDRELSATFTSQAKSYTDKCLTWVRKPSFGRSLISSRLFGNVKELRGTYEAAICGHSGRQSL
jgi:hypothetical protein